MMERPPAACPDHGVLGVRCRETGDGRQGAALVRVWLGDVLLLISREKWQEILAVEVAAERGTTKAEVPVSPKGYAEADRRGFLWVYRAGFLVAALCVAFLLTGCGTGVAPVQTAEAEVRGQADVEAALPRPDAGSIDDMRDSLRWVMWAGAGVMIGGIAMFFFHKRSGALMLLGGGGAILLAGIIPALAPYALGIALVGIGAVGGYYQARHNLTTGEDDIEELIERRMHRA